MKKLSEWNIVIPARRGSKGFPGKNRKLLSYTLNSIPHKLLPKVFLSSDDPVLLTQAKEDYPDINCHTRSYESATDTASGKICIKEVIEEYSLSGNIIMLYLTYPSRTWEDIVQIWEWYNQQGATSLLCKEDITFYKHPYLCLYQLPEHKGKQIVSHNLYRRQDYPSMFVLSHFVSIYRTNEIDNINNNFYNDETLFYDIGSVVDVDKVEDLKTIVNIHN